MLKTQGIEPEVVEYLKSPLGWQEIDALLGKLGVEPREIMRRDEPEYRELGLDRPERTREELIQALHEHPRLLQRPIVETVDRAAVGRPPEKVLEILGQ